MLVLAIFLVIMWSGQITGRRIEPDAQETTRMAVNLARHGVLSLAETAPYTPTNFREPLPAAVSALGISLIDRIQGASEPQAYLQGPRARLLKYQNILWLSLLTVGAFVAARTLTSSFWFGMLAAVVINEPLLPQEFTPIDNLLTEIPATAVLMSASICLGSAFARRSWPLYLLAGLLFGLTALIKAILLQVAAGLLLVLLLTQVVQRARYSWRSGLRDILVMGAGLACVVVPWMWRNQVELGTVQITQRGGVALWERALEDQISWRQYEGSFFVWARPGFIQNSLGAWMKFSADDVQRPDGSLVRLNSDFGSPVSTQDLPATEAGMPEKTVTIFREAIAENVRLEILYAANGAPHPDIAAEKALYDIALTTILRHPFRHLALCLPFLWRGAFVTLPMLMVGFAFSWRFRRADLALFLLPSLGIILLYAGFTPFYPRYSWPSHLLAIVGLVVAVALLWRSRPSMRYEPKAVELQ